MDTLLHQAVLYAHVVAFAIALSTVLRADLALLRTQRIDWPRLSASARTLSGALAALWLSGLALVAFDTGLDRHALALGPKLLAKLVVVSALTLNGLALHGLAFPRLRKPPARGGAGMGLPVVLGAVSTASWLYASFVGVARLVAPAMSFADFMLLYAALLAGAIAVGLLFVRPRLLRLAGSAN